MKNRVGVEECFLRTHFGRFNEDCITVIIVENHDVIVPITRRNAESSGLVCADLASDFLYGNETVMSSFIWFVGFREVVLVEFD